MDSHGSLDTCVANKCILFIRIYPQPVCRGRLTGSRDLRGDLSSGILFVHCGKSVCLRVLRRQRKLAEEDNKLCFEVAYAKFVWGSGLSWR